MSALLVKLPEYTRRGNVIYVDEEGKSYTNLASLVGQLESGEALSDGTFRGKQSGAVYSQGRNEPRYVHYRIRNPTL